MRSALVALILMCSFAVSSYAEELPEKTLELKDGSMLFLHPDGTGRMVDVHGKPMTMKDGVEMQTAAGEIVMMQNKKVWVRWGPPGKGHRVLRDD